MKYQIKRRWWIFLFYAIFCTVQRCKGITSKTDRDQYHYILMDFDNVEYYNVIKELERISVKYNIEGFTIFSDKVHSYRVFSQTIVDFRTLLKILLDTEGIDYMFFKWTVKRGYATIRVGDKKGRDKNKIIGIVGKSAFGIIKEKLKFIEFETDI